VLLFGNRLFVCLATSRQGRDHIASSTFDATCGWIPEDWRPRTYAFFEIAIYGAMTKRGTVLFLVVPVECAFPKPGERARISYLRNFYEQAAALQLGGERSAVA
jgi:hypothetical protein